MSAPPPNGTGAPAPPSPERSRRTLWLVLAVCAAPVIASFATYFLFPGRTAANYGELLPTQAAPALTGRTAEGRDWTLADERGRWVVIVASRAPCDRACEGRLYASRQARLLQGREQERVRRVWLVREDLPAAPSNHADLLVVRGDAASVDRLPRGETMIYLVDPLGNQVLAWPDMPDVRAVARDLARLLKASRIG